MALPTMPRIETTGKGKKSKSGGELQVMYPEMPADLLHNEPDIQFHKTDSRAIFSMEVILGFE